MVAGSSLADALPSFLLDARLSSLGGCFVTSALSKLYATIMYPIHTGSIGRFWVLRGVALSFFIFSCSVPLFHVTHHKIGVL